MQNHSSELLEMLAETYDQIIIDSPPVMGLADAGADTGTLTVRVPGGDVEVTITDATSYLRGPSVLVAHGEVSEEWWRAQ